MATLFQHFCPGKYFRLSFPVTLKYFLGEEYLWRLHACVEVVMFTKQNKAKKVVKNKLLNILKHSKLIK